MKYFWWSKTEPDDRVLAKFYSHDPAFGTHFVEHHFQPSMDLIEGLLTTQYTEISWQSAQSMGLPV